MPMSASLLLEVSRTFCETCSLGEKRRPSLPLLMSMDCNTAHTAFHLPLGLHLDAKLMKAASLSIG